jgi:hypothetical protein
MTINGYGITGNYRGIGGFIGGSGTGGKDKSQAKYGCTAFVYKRHAIGGF